MLVVGLVDFTNPGGTKGAQPLSVEVLSAPLTSIIVLTSSSVLDSPLQYPLVCEYICQCMLGHRKIAVWTIYQLLVHQSF